MITMPSLQTAQFRLAQHYLKKLRTAAEAVRRGHASVSYGLRIFEHEWEHIQHWQRWTGAQHDADNAIARLCLEFPLVGSDVLHMRQNPEERVAWLQTALSAAERLNDQKAQCAILFSLFEALFAVNDLHTAEQHVRRLFSLTQKTRDRLFRGRALYALGCIYEEQGVYAEACSYYRQSLEIFEGLRAVADTSMALNGLGSIALYMAEYQQAHDYFLRHLALSEASGHQGNICRALLAVAEGLWGLEDLEAAEQYARRAIGLCRALGYQRMLSAGLLALARYLVEQNNLEAACAPYEEGIQVARASGSDRNLIHGLSSLGYLQFRLGSYAEALRCFNEALKMARQSQQLRFVCNILRNMTNTYLATGNLDRARQHLREGLILAQNLGSDFQKLRGLCSAIWLWQQEDRPEQAAEWAGLVLEQRAFDKPVFDPVLARLEATLGTQQYHLALQQGRTHILDDVVSEVLRLLSRGE
jgi:tetratricopeptide (TPR) repeat protein